MTTINFATPEDREAIRKLCDQIASRNDEVSREAHTILKAALDASAPAHELIRQSRDEWDSKTNPNAGVKPAFPKGRFASKEKGGV